MRLRYSFLALLACSSSSGGKGNVQVFIDPEASITEGVAAGDGDENMRDGWSVTYTRFLVTVGNFRARSSSTGHSVRDATIYVLDLKKAPPGGYVTFSARDLDAERYDKVGQDMPAAAPGARALPPTTDADVRLMIDKGYSIYVEGSLSKADGQSCVPGKPMDCVPAKTISFKWGFAMATSFDDCEAQGVPGFAIPAGGTTQVKPTIHGDHWFFVDMTEGAEVTKRYAQYIADSDLDRDGETTLDELSRVRAADVFPSDKYRLSGAVGGVPIATALDYVKGQARTIHDFQGDGECPTRAILK
jgi:hypothetical protein